MMPTLTFEWDSRALSIWRGRAVEKALASALSKAGSGAIRALKAESARKLRERKRFKVGAVNKALPISYPSSKEIARLAWRMDVSGALVPVSAFPHRQVRAGVSVEINAGKRVTIASAFSAAMASGHKGVFTAFGPKRIIRSGTYKGKFRRPIKEAFTTRVVDVFRDADMVPAVMARAQSVFARDFARLLPIELKRIGAK